MNTNLLVKVILILFLIITACFYTFPLKDRINLGLDLQGGMHLILAVDTSKLEGKAKQDAAERALEVIRNRIDEFGVKEPVIQLQGEDQIVLQLPGLTERDRVLDLIKRTAVLEFKLVSTDTQKLSDAIAGNVPEGYELKELETDKLLLESQVLLRGDTIVNADVRFDQSSFGQPIVGLQFNKEGSEKFAKITGDNVGRRLAIVLDGKVYSAPRINEAIPSGEAVISGNFAADEAKDLALVLRVGSLPAPVSVAEERTVGALLGLDSIRSGVRASILGIALVFGFMAIYYMFAGVITCFALALNLLIILGFLGLSGATLTLPGIAGIVLTLGMAVDANVLINERIREELALGRPLQTAIKLGYDLAFSAIFDSNLTTLIAAFFLFQFGTGPIRGFAVTLSVGLLASMFTSVVVTKVIFEVILNRFRQFKKLVMLQMLKSTKINFIKMGKFFIVASLIMIIVSCYTFFKKGSNALGLDFNGGQLQEYSFDKPVAIEAIRSALKDAGLPEASIQQFKDNAKVILIKTPSDTSKIVQDELKKAFTDNKFQILRIENVGPVVGNQLRSKALLAIIWSMVGIFIYVMFRFKHFDFALGGIIALIHDVVIAAGILLLCNRQIDLLVVTALLTLAGYSINDTIVIYDRIREISHKMHKLKLVDAINIALNQTLSRTIITSFVTLLVVIALFIWGGEVLNSFALVLLIGFIVGCYSTIFIATPLVVFFHNATSKRTK